MEVTTEQIKEAASYIKSVLSDDFVLEVGIIGGSGLSALEGAIEGIRTEVGYESIKGFPISTVSGHAGKLIFGTIGMKKTPAVLMSGRAHLYEGNDLQKATFPVRVLKLLGMKILIVTNAAGGLNKGYTVGDVVLLNDHINFPGLSGINPLRGPNLDSFGPRFLALSDAYDLELRRSTHDAWKEICKDVPNAKPLAEGVYAFVGGPKYVASYHEHANVVSYETRAECRMLALLGADLVGMSTVPEVIIARHSGVRVLAISLVTNMAVLDHSTRGDEPSLAQKDASELEHEMEDGKANHEDVVEVAKSTALVIKKLIIRTIEVSK